MLSLARHGLFCSRFNFASMRYLAVTMPHEDSCQNVRLNWTYIGLVLICFTHIRLALNCVDLCFY